MAFTDTQTRQLKAKLDAQNVRTRKANGNTLHYVEGWHAIAEANRIFGFDAWDRRTVSVRCVWTGTDHLFYLAAYTARVRIRVRAGDVTVTRDGSGTGEGRALTPGQAHELALKSAETDATKRALATFGNPFGLALYDPQQAGVRQPKGNAAPATQEPLVLRSAEGNPPGTYENAEAFAKALRHEMEQAPTIELLFAIWEQNVATVRAVNDARKQNGAASDSFAKELVAHLKSCAAALVRPATEPARPNELLSDSGSLKPREAIDKSQLTHGEIKRHRSKEHLRHVARKPCLICGRTPAQAHHIRYAQPRGVGLKVSDEFTVPLCAIHHTENHATGDERHWWEERKIDPLPIAAGFWKESQRASQ
jgi:hypothetical protein